jgi:hypothetical protein
MQPTLQPERRELAPEPRWEMASWKQAKVRIAGCGWLLNYWYRYHSGARVPRASCPLFLSRLSPFVPYSSPFYPALASFALAECALVTRRAPVERASARPGDRTGRPHVM